MIKPWYCGIDPGIGGAIAWVDGNTGWVRGVDDFTKNPRFYRGISTHLSIPGGSPLSSATILIEDVSASVGASPSSKAAEFSFGYNFGVITEQARNAGATIYSIPPKVWKDSLGLTGQGKGASIERACHLPGAAPYLKRKGDDGRAEAILLARFLWEHREDEAFLASLLSEVAMATPGRRKKPTKKRRSRSRQRAISPPRLSLFPKEARAFPQSQACANGLRCVPQSLSHPASAYPRLPV